MMKLETLVKKLEKEILNQKKAETREAYNRIIDAIQGFSMDSILTAIELVKQTLVLQKIKEIYPELFK